MKPRERVNLDRVCLCALPEDKVEVGTLRGG
jgi:hypothetical protein